ncbi:hypothetical protein [Bradyrhizobium sp. Ai1a-2]|uniref:hypothetical protein n=1 Tax=Bradyrhizobium sp. Ai1a-2 TaxID=196490 RepID=UPI00047FF1E0|nr:hypothetical protein [Bradyrhizobium sp. Ai1a-2]
MAGKIEIDPTGSNDTGVCDCCGHSSRCVWGEAYADGRCVAVYFVHWTLEHVPDHGASIELIIGQWGEGTSAQHRIAIALAYRLMEGIPSMMVINASAMPVARSPLVGRALCRDDVIGTPLAQNAFSIADAVLAQDHRVAELLGR